MHTLSCWSDNLLAGRLFYLAYWGSVTRIMAAQQDVELDLLERYYAKMNPVAANMLNGSVSLSGESRQRILKAANIFKPSVAEIMSNGASDQSEYFIVIVNSGLNELRKVASTDDELRIFFHAGAALAKTDLARLSQPVVTYNADNDLKDLLASYSATFSDVLPEHIIDAYGERKTAAPIGIIPSRQNLPSGLFYLLSFQMIGLDNDKPFIWITPAPKKRRHKQWTVIAADKNWSKSPLTVQLADTDGIALKKLIEKYEKDREDGFPENERGYLARTSLSEGETSSASSKVWLSLSKKLPLPGEWIYVDTRNKLPKSGMCRLPEWFDRSGLWIFLEE